MNGPTRVKSWPTSLLSRNGETRPKMTATTSAFHDAGELRDAPRQGNSYRPVHVGGRFSR